tara:strand:- start:131 stop:799 length:669 start_codon:yes stop_codon:yes gene_type:complete
MKIFKLLLSLIFISNIFAASKLRDVNWKVIKEKDGITVFEPVKYEHPSGLIPIRFKATLNYDISRVLTVLADDKRKHEWMPNLKESKVVERKSLQLATVYYRYDSPWPFRDRDFLVTNNAVFDPPSMTINVDIRSVKHDKMPVNKKFVRGITYDGYSIIKPGKRPNTTVVEMAFLNDFGGFLPGFVVNLVQRQWPYKFMSHLSSQLKKDNISINPAFKYSKK